MSLTCYVGQVCFFCRSMSTARSDMAQFYWTHEISKFQNTKCRLGDAHWPGWRTTAGAASRHGRSPAAALIGSAPSRMVTPLALPILTSPHACSSEVEHMISGTPKAKAIPRIHESFFSSLSRKAKRKLLNTFRPGSSRNVEGSRVHQSPFQGARPARGTSYPLREFPSAATGGSPQTSQPESSPQHQA